jgi:hypothetical protein
LSFLEKAILEKRKICIWDVRLGRFLSFMHYICKGIVGKKK